MRKILFSLLLATTMASPALAERPGHHDDSSNTTESRSDHSQARSDRAAERSQRAEARQERVQAQGDVGVQNVERMNAARGQVFARERGSANVNELGRPTLGEGERMTDGIAQWRGREPRQVDTQQVQQQQQQQRYRDGSRQRYDRRSGDAQWQGDRNSDRSRRDTNREAYSQRQTQQWDSNWRHDRRYDWRDYRRHHRSTFHIGFYYDPFGYGYQRYNIGYRMQPSYYGSNYWLNDPAMYALPYAPYPFRWVRYYNDALLVNTYTGQVADVIYDFFW